MRRKRILTSFKGDKVIVIRNVLTPKECAQFITYGEKQGFERAGNYIKGSVGQFRYSSSRTNSRVIFDDKDMAEVVWSRIQQHVPPQFKKHKVQRKPLIPVFIFTNNIAIWG